MAKKFKVGATPDQAIELVQRLATDDAFRRELERNPGTTLAQMKVTLPDSIIAPGFKLPPKSVFAAMQTDLKIGGQGQALVEVAFLAFFAFFRK